MIDSKRLRRDDCNKKPPTGFLLSGGFLFAEDQPLFGLPSTTASSHMAAAPMARMSGDEL
jgi:hypothetical protein